MKRLTLFFALGISILFYSCQNQQYNCFDPSEYNSYMEFGSVDFETAINQIYYDANIPMIDTTTYDKYTFHEWYWGKYIERDGYVWCIYKWLFDAINVYKEFLSDESDCNQGDEPLKDFICRYSHDDKFRMSRIRVDGKDKDSVFNRSKEQNFKFYISIDKFTAKSWFELGYKNAVYSWRDKWGDGQRYTFSRINNKWYLTDYYDLDDNPLWNGE